MTAIEVIRLVGPEFESVYDDAIADWISLVEPMVSKKKFGKLYHQAIGLLVCHKLKMAGLGESGMIPSIADTARITSVTEGKTSVSFANNQYQKADPDAEFYLTSYGMQYLTLRRGLIVPILCSGQDDLM